ncbi:MAG: heme NO-binding domain-containing protein [Planctomycetaceae bacterium]|nr:heme NO-binding domain-containing protein [Planctomycetaceae bacterium]
MKGIVFTLLNELVEKQFGLAMWDAVLMDSGESGIYTAAASYPDQSILNLVMSLSARSGLPPDDLIRAFGTYMVSGFAEQYPDFFPPGISAKELLMSVQGIIHVEVKKLFPDAILPQFEYEDTSPTTLTMKYRSPRSLCVLAEGLIDGTGTFFGEKISREHSQCVKRGDRFCQFDLTFGGRT